MPGSTPIFGLPYQTLADPPNGPGLGEDLATAVESTLGQLGTAWVQAAPTWQQAGGATLAIGNGTLLMRRKDIGFGSAKTIHARLELVRGSTSNSGSDTYAWTLPAGWPTPRNFRFTGTGAVYLASGVTRPCIAHGVSGTGFVLVYTDTAARVGNQAGGSGHPSGGPWAVGDAIVADITYEAA